MLSHPWSYTIKTTRPRASLAPFIPITASIVMDLVCNYPRTSLTLRPRCTLRTLGTTSSHHAPAHGPNNTTSHPPHPLCAARCDGVIWSPDLGWVIDACSLARIRSVPESNASGRLPAGKDSSCEGECVSCSLCCSVCVFMAR